MITPRTIIIKSKNKIKSKLAKTNYYEEIKTEYHQKKKVIEKNKANENLLKNLY